MKRIYPLRMNKYAGSALFGLIGLAVTAIIVPVFAKLIEAGKLPLEKLPLYAGITQAISALSACILSAAMAKEKKLLCSMITGGVYFLSLCALNGILQRGEFKRLPVTLVIVAASVLLAAVLSLKRQKHY